VRLLPEPVERVAVVRALEGLGDLLCIVPALRALRAALPAARVELITLPRARALFARFDDLVDEVLPFPGFPGVPEVSVDARRTTAFLADAQARRLDLALQLHGSGVTSNAFVALLGARAVAGFHPPGGWSPDPERFLPYPPREHEVRRPLALLAHLGIPPAGEQLELPVLDEDVAEAAELLRGAGEGTYAVVHPGASEAARRWPPARFAAVADALAARGLVPVLTGTAAERPVVGAVTGAMRSPHVDLAGRTSLGALAALVRDANLVVTNDTGVSHLAAAVGAPSVVVFSASDPARWAPLDRERHRALGGLLDDGLRIGDVDVGEVLAAADDLLRQRAPAPAP
jgi:ADP-heptose:LPS heptosyltransferase